jgi:hypothetical protein
VSVEGRREPSVDGWKRVGVERREKGLEVRIADVVGCWGIWENLYPKGKERVSYMRFLGLLVWDD